MWCAPMPPLACVLCVFVLLARFVLPRSLVFLFYSFFLAGRACDRVGPEPGAANHDQVRHHQHPRAVRSQGRPQSHQDRPCVPLRLSRRRVQRNRCTKLVSILTGFIFFCSPCSLAALFFRWAPSCCAVGPRFVTVSGSERRNNL